MITAPDNWNALWAASHRIQWQYIIGGTVYGAEDVQGVPTINRPLMEEPCIGRCCTGDLTLMVRRRADSSIPKAASVVAQCRLTNLSGSSVTEWVDMGHYWITKRAGSSLITLICRDSMIMAGRTYLDKTQYIDWPVSMNLVVNEIAALMGVELDSRSVIQSGSIFRVDYPNEDTLMSEVLAYIAAAHGGHFVMTHAGKLRLIPFPATSTPVQDLGGAFSGYTPYSTGIQTVSRVTLTDDADNQYTAGDDSGVELTASCNYAKQAMVNLFSGWLIGQTFLPFEMTGARISPLIELGDTFSASYKGEALQLMANTIVFNCSPYATASISYYMEEDDEEEIPYTSPSDLAANRYLTTSKAYFGNRINRTEGFVSEYMQDDEPIARMVANSERFSMQRLNDSGQWEDILYFDPVKRTYKFVGEVDVKVDAGANTFCQDEAPITGIKEGDLWVDSANNYKLFRYNGMAWESVQDLNIPDILGQMSAANTSLNALSTGIDAKVDTTYLTDELNGLVKTFTSALSLKADELTLSFSGTAQDAANEVNNRFATLIRASGDGVEIGKSGSNFKVLINNTEMSFYNGTSKVAYVSNQKMFITAAQVTSSLEIGQDGGNTFSWVKTNNGLSLSYVSADA